LKLDEASRKLIDIKDRIGRLKPLNHDPEKYFTDRGEIERELGEIACLLSDGRVETRKKPDSQFNAGVISHRGRAIPVSTRGRPVESDAKALARKVFK
jgi:hypothetical protein